METPAVARHAELELHDAMSSVARDPLEFVRMAYPWPIHGQPGPDAIQTRFLTALGVQVRARGFNGTDPVLPVRMGLSSGHGIGKSALGAWIVDWIMSTRRNCRGTITANTNDQLEKKTWAAVREWTARCITAHWFEINTAIMFRKGCRATWFCAPASCDEHNSEAFAGQHARGSTSFYLNDEDSAVPDRIHDVEEGGLTSGEDMIFLFGNPTRNVGKFHRAAFGADRHRWDIQIVDARESKFSNQALIREWQDDYGEDSDFFRVRVRGLPPNASELQFIGADLVYGAQTRVIETLPDEPLVAGVDVSGGGSAWTCCWFRRGVDARSILPIRMTGEQSRDRQHVVSQLALALQEHAPAAMFIDSAFGAVIVQRLNDLGFTQVYETNFGGPSPDEHQENQRAYQWALMKEWLKRGGIPNTHERLATDLAGPGFHLNKKNKLVLEAKESMQKRGVASPDDADALCFEAQTLIWTPEGRRAIASLTPGDAVITPGGVSRVVGCVEMFTPRLTTVRFSNGATLRGTPQHEMFTFSRGARRLDTLSFTDEMDA